MSFDELDLDDRVILGIKKFNFDFFDLPLDIFVPIIRKVKRDV